MKFAMACISAVVLSGLLAVDRVTAQEAWEGAAEEVNRELDQPALIEKGRYLAIAGDCQACHTRAGGAPFAGGRPMKIPLLGTLYSSNITPDIQQGIGGWSLEDFDDALRRGIGRDGRNLYPAMPYDSYSRISDDDIKALYAYFMFGLEPVHDTPPANKIRRALSARWPLAIWNFLFAPGEPFTPDPQRSAEWNRGAYLVQSLAHCGECHTPRGIAFQTKAHNETDKGFLAGGPILDGWQAYNITPHPISGIGQWSSEQLTRYLKTGHVNRLAQAGGPMAEAIENSFAKMTDGDIAAMVTYLRSIPPIDSGEKYPRQSLGSPATQVIIKRGNTLAIDRSPNSRSDGARLYLGLCASCHGVDGTGSRDGYYPSLVYNSTVGAKSDHNLRQAILHGISRTVGGEEIMMPGFASELDEGQRKRLLEYLRRQFATPSKGDAAAQN